MLVIKSGPLLWSIRAEQNHIRRSWRLAGVLDTLPQPMNDIPWPSSPKTLRRPLALGLDSRGEISPKETGQRCGMSSPFSSAQAQDFPPLLLPQSRVQLLRLATGSPWGPVAGWSQGHGFRGGGGSAESAPQEDSPPAGQWQFRKVNRPQREGCLFFGGVVTRQGRNLGGRAQNSRKGVGGLSGNPASLIH